MSRYTSCDQRMMSAAGIASGPTEETPTDTTLRFFRIHAEEHGQVMAAQAAEIIVLRHRSAKLRTWLYVALAAAALAWPPNLLPVEQPVQIRLTVGKVISGCCHMAH